MTRRAVDMGRLVPDLTKRSLCRAIPRCADIAFPAVQHLPEHLLATLRRDHPGPVGPRRIVADVLVVAAFELGHPVLRFIEMKAGDASFHETPPCHAASNRPPMKRAIAMAVPWS